MALGALVRRVLGARIGRRAGEHYRAIYVDLGKVAEALATVIPRDAHLLDVGGGDGQPINHLLSDARRLNRDHIGSCTLRRSMDRMHAIEGQVKRMPRTSLAQFVRACQRVTRRNFNCGRNASHSKVRAPQISRSVGVLLESITGPTNYRERRRTRSLACLLGFWSDRYVTGDRNVSLIFERAT